MMVSKKELAETEADLAWWRSVFDHMIGWKVLGWTYRDSVIMIDDKDKSQSYTYGQVRPILTLKGIWKND
jgi:hypothetical protein